MVLLHSLLVQYIESDFTDFLHSLELTSFFLSWYSFPIILFGVCDEPQCAGERACKSV